MHFSRAKRFGRLGSLRLFPCNHFTLALLRTYMCMVGGLVSPTVRDALCGFCRLLVGKATMPFEFLHLEPLLSGDSHNGGCGELQKHYSVVFHAISGPLAQTTFPVNAKMLSRTNENSGTCRISPTKSLTVSARPGNVPNRANRSADETCKPMYVRSSCSLCTPYRMVRMGQV